jgi:hypothetical protein
MAQKRDRKQERLVQEHQWRERLEAWRASGLTQVGFCLSHGISMGSFSRWKSALVGRGKPKAPIPASGTIAAADGFPSGSPEGLGWTEVRLPSASAARTETGPGGSGFEIVLPRGWSVRLGPQFEAEPLRRLLSVLEERSC